MPRTHAHRKAQQLDLMTIPAPQVTLPPTAAAFEAAQRQIAQLTEQLRSEQRRSTELSADILRLSLELHAARQQQPQGTHDTLIRELIKLAHPDRWSQGQPATELAHEITVRLTAGKKARR